MAVSFACVSPARYPNRQGYGKAHRPHIIRKAYMLRKKRFVLHLFESEIILLDRILRDTSLEAFIQCACANFPDQTTQTAVRLELLQRAP